ncbi:hypothetical protein BAE44_0023311 [Dichanthelium oligosanthes]|uniref:Uncharacterized protein n=1 Tax=Dichanthelium oligosanthes TaxID=888268 RepID=A0A1E5US32_9POAL|nr:hypothetical protein BAE44_0023311 [Dichanthelium oligosanthes]
MAKAARTTRSLLFVSVLIPLLATLGADGVGGGSSRCPLVPSMTAQSACSAVSGTRHMRELCLRTLRSGAGAAVLPVTRHAATAVRGALDSYAATVAAATSLLDGGAVPADAEKAAFGDCMVGYGRARGAMSRVADDLAAGGCGDGAAGLKAGYTAGLRGMDGCRRGLLNYPASPLYARNLADRNMTLLAALLCSLVPAPPSA